MDISLLHQLKFSVNIFNLSLFTLLTLLIINIIVHNDKQPTSENNEFEKVNQSVIYDDDDDDDDDNASLSESSAIITQK